MAVELLTSPSSFVGTVFDRAAVSKLLDDHASGDRNEQPRIWTLLSLEVWHRELVKKMTCDGDPAPRTHVESASGSF